MKAKFDYASLCEIGFEWAKHYKTEIGISRLSRELHSLRDEDHTLVSKALIECIKDTPAKYFSWNKFRDAWKSWLPSDDMGAEEAFKLLVSSPSGYSPTAGTYWSIGEIRPRLGSRIADALAAIGGPGELAKMTTDNRKWVEKAFIKAY